jgi:hypothetical protein
MKLIIPTIVVVLALLGATQATGRECTREEGYAAETVTGHLNSWDNVYMFFKEFGHCYDGAIAEGAQDKVQMLWADHWNDLPKMIALAKEDPAFKAFLWSIIESEAFPQTTFATVLQNATRRCPKVAAEFCGAVKNAARPK